MFNIGDDDLLFNYSARRFNRYHVYLTFRDIQEPELQKFYSRLIKLLKAKEHGHETVDSLQRLRLILSANKYSRQ